MIDPAHLEIFESDLGEEKLSIDKSLEEKIVLPITRKGFETLLSEAAFHAGIPVDDSARVLLCGFVHHIDRGTCTTTLSQIAAALRKQLSNGLTILINDEIDQKRRAALQEAQAAKTPTLVPDVIEESPSNEQNPA